MIQDDTNKTPKSAIFFICEMCDFNCSKKSDFERHLSRPKHIAQCDRIQKDTQQNAKNAEQSKYMCECGNIYKHHSGLWRHKNKGKCSNKSEELVGKTYPLVTTDKDELLNYLIKENQEFKNLILEFVKKDTYTTNNSNNTIQTNSHNKAFNLNLFLNETCKDAMNISDFLDSIQLQLSDLEKMEEIGFVQGISNIIIKNLNALDVSKRPIHCTDKKRETIYIKDQGIWEKDEENTKIRGFVKKVAGKNARLLQVFKEKHPDYNQYHSKYSTQYNKLIIEAFGGKGDNDLEKEDKIIRNITKNIVVEK